ncbi:MAG: hypothetical protein M1833_000456, partial [Piccolia ochrophora]
MARVQFTLPPGLLFHAADFAEAAGSDEVGRQAQHVIGRTNAGREGLERTRLVVNSSRAGDGLRQGVFTGFGDVVAESDAVCAVLQNIDGSVI